MENRTTVTEGQDRLTLQYDEGNFQALVWSFEHEGEWSCRAVITQADFERGSERERWVCELHSFDPAIGHAIIKVGEMEVPQDKAGPNGFRRCIHSWRKWDLLANRELELLRTCKDPFEEYENQPSRHKSVIETDNDFVAIDCRVEDWDSCLYNNLYAKRHIELRNLHFSYGSYMSRLAEMYCMEFVGHFTENRGEFKPRS